MNRVTVYSCIYFFVIITHTRCESPKKCFGATLCIYYIQGRTKIFFHTICVKNTCVAERQYIIINVSGIICSQGGSMWSELDQLKQTLDNCKRHFRTVQYATSSVPSYPDGQIGYVLAAVNENVNLKNPCYRFTESQIDQLKLRYYNHEVHGAAFVLPNFIRRVICK